jgi:hypothetical protein
MVCQHAGEMEKSSGAHCSYHTPLLFDAVTPEQLAIAVPDLVGLRLSRPVTTQGRSSELRKPRTDDEVRALNRYPHLRNTQWR